MHTQALSKIPALFYSQPENSILTIYKNTRSYSFEVGQDASFQKNATTIKNFIEIIGPARLEQLYSHPITQIDKSMLEQRTLFLTKRVVRKMFLAFLDVKKSDFHNCKKSVEEQFSHLIIFTSSNDVKKALLGAHINIEEYHIDTAETSGKGLHGLIEKVQFCLHHHFHIIKNPHAKDANIYDSEFLTSRLADREMQEGSVIHLYDGYFFVDHIFAKGGAYIAVLKDLQQETRVKIVCRGTAFRPNATGGYLSCINDLLLEIGSMGIKAVWDDLSQYLKKNTITSMTILGKSLGGAHAQLLAVLIEGILNIPIERLITHCSVGVGSQINALFKKEVLAKRNTPFHIDVIRNGDAASDDFDHIPCIGGVHLGEGCPEELCQTRIQYLYPHPIKPPRGNLFSSGYISLLKNLTRTLSVGHCRQVTLQKFTSHRIEDRDEIHEHLRVGTKLETTRKCIALFLNVCTLFVLNGKSFSTFFKNQKNT